MNSLDSGDELDQFDCNCGLVITFYPNLSSFSVQFHFRIVNLSNFNLNFGKIAIYIFGNIIHL